MSTQAIAIHATSARITAMDGIELAAQSPSTKNMPEKIPNGISSTPTQGVPIITNPSLYTTYNGSLIEMAQVDTAPEQTISIIEPDHTLLRTIYRDKPTWYFRLVPHKKFPNRPCLINKERIEKGNIIICEQTQYMDKKTGTIKTGHRYCKFNSPQELWAWTFLQENNKRCAFECILGEQEIHFDLDVSQKDFPGEDIIFIANMVKDRVIHNIISILGQHGVNITKDNILITNSHGPIKRSYHITVNGYYHETHLEAKAFYDLVFSQPGNISPKYWTETTVDNSVYKLVQQFRLLYHTKINENRYKTVDPETTYIPTDANTDNLKSLRFFESSLVSFTNDCVKLPSFLPKGPQQRKLRTRASNVTPSERDKLIDYAVEVYNKSEIKGYEIGEDLSSDEIGVRLDRIEPSKCIVHHKEHDNDNAKLVVYPDHTVKFVCFRNYGGRNHKILARGDCWTLGDNNIPTESNVSPIPIEEPEKEPEDPFATWFDPNYAGDCAQTRTQAMPIINEKVLEGEAAPINDNTCLPKRVQATAIINGVLITPNNSGFGVSCVNTGKIILSPTSTANTNPSQVVNTNKIADKDTLAYFVKHHVSSHPSEMITLDAFVSKYNEFRAIYGYSPGTTIGISMQLGKISSSLRTNLRGPRNNQHKVILGHKLVNLDFLHVRLDVERKASNPPIVINPNVISIQSNNGKQLSSLKFPHPVMHPLVLPIEEDRTKNSGRLPIIKQVCQQVCPTMLDPLTSYTTAQQNVVMSQTPLLFATMLATMENEDGINNFKEGRLRKRSNGCESLCTIYDEYRKNWCTNNNISKIPNKDKFIERLQCLGVEIRKIGSDRLKDKICIFGWKLLENTLSNNYENLWKYWTEQYKIGWHNGPYPYKISDRSEWNNISITYSYESKLKPVYKLIRNGNKFICCIRANCGAGKTVGLKPFIVKRILECLREGKELKVLIIGNRITIDNKYSSEYDIYGFKNYLKLLGIPLHNIPKLVVQYNSLYQVSSDEPYDILILDEYCSSEQLQYGFIEHKSECYEKLKQLIKETPQVFIADAGLENKHILNLTNITDRPIIVHQNMHQKHWNKRVIYCEKKESVKLKLLQSIRRGERSVVPVGTKSLADYYEKCILEEIPGTKVVKYTSETIKSDIDPVTEWDNYQVIIFTSTIMCGNSYTNPIDNVFCVMDRNTCGPKDALQMIMRCRNITSGNIYLHVDITGPGRETIPKEIRCGFGTIKEYLLQRHVIIRGTLHPNGRLDPDHPELHRLPMDMIRHNPMRKTINPDDPFFNGYCGYVQDRAKQERHYLFLLFLYLRDQGVQYGGELSEFNPDEIEDVRVDCKNYVKETNEKDVDDQVRSLDITDEKYKRYIDAGKRRIRLTKEERNSMRKHGLKNLLETKNITHWAVKAMKGKKNKYNNLKHYKDCIGVRDETERLRLMAECANKKLSKINEDDNSIVILAEDERILTYRHCVHSLNIIQMAVPGVKLEDMCQKTQIVITEDDLSAQLKEYFRVYMDDIKYLRSKIIYKVSPKIDRTPIQEPHPDNINTVTEGRNLANINLSNETQLTLLEEQPVHGDITSEPVTNIMDNIDYIRSASEIIKSCFCMKFAIDKKNRCLIGNKPSRNIYISSPWEVREGKILPRKENFTVDGEDLTLRRLHDVYTELPELVNGSTTGVEWLMQKIDNLKSKLTNTVT